MTCTFKRPASSVLSLNFKRRGDVPLPAKVFGKNWTLNSAYALFAASSGVPVLSLTSYVITACSKAPTPEMNMSEAETPIYAIDAGNLRDGDEEMTWPGAPSIPTSVLVALPFGP